MDLLNTFASLFSNFGNLTWQMVVMWGIGALLIYLAIAKKMLWCHSGQPAPLGCHHAGGYGRPDLCIV